jgi:hypothetical protein
MITTYAIVYCYWQVLQAGGIGKQCNLGKIPQFYSTAEACETVRAGYPDWKNDDGHNGGYHQCMKRTAPAEPAWEAIQ